MQQNAANTIQNKNLKQHNAANIMENAPGPKSKKIVNLIKHIKHPFVCRHFPHHLGSIWSACGSSSSSSSSSSSLSSSSWSWSWPWSSSSSSSSSPSSLHHRHRYHRHHRHRHHGHRRHHLIVLAEAPARKRVSFAEEVDVKDISPRPRVRLGRDNYRLTCCTHACTCTADWNMHTTRKTFTCNNM